MSYFTIAAPELYQFVICILLLLAWWLFFVEYRAYRVDLLRHRLFVARSKLFFKAKDGQFCNSRAYGLTRTTINGTIRFAHDLSFLRLVVVFATDVWFGRDDLPERYRKALEAGLAELPPDARDAITDAHVALHLAILAHVVKTSIVLAPPFYFLRPLLKRLNIAADMRKRFVTSNASRERWAVIDAEVNAIGKEAFLPPGKTLMAA